MKIWMIVKNNEQSPTNLYNDAVEDTEAKNYDDTVIIEKYDNKISIQGPHWPSPTAEAMAVHRIMHNGINTYDVINTYHLECALVMIECKITVWWGEWKNAWR